RPAPSTVVKHNLPSIIAHLIFLWGQTRRNIPEVPASPRMKGFQRSRPACRLGPLAFASPQGNECNLRGEVTKKFSPTAKRDILTALFCRVAAKMNPLPSGLSFCSDAFRHIVIHSLPFSGFRSWQSCRCEFG